MNKKTGNRVLYSRVLSTDGDSLIVYPRLHPAFMREFFDRIHTIEQINTDPDLRAMDASLEWEKAGDFEKLGECEQSCLECYRESLISCLDGVDYDHGDYGMPSRWLMNRFVWLYETILKRCQHTELLDKLIVNDPMIAKCYREFSLDR